MTNYDVIVTSLYLQLIWLTEEIPDLFSEHEEADCNKQVMYAIFKGATGVKYKDTYMSVLLLHLFNPAIAILY